MANTDNVEKLKQRIDQGCKYSHGDITREEVARSILMNEYGEPHASRMLRNRKLRKAFQLSAA